LIISVDDADFNANNQDDIYRDTLVVIRQDQRIKTAEMEDAAAKARL